MQQHELTAKSFSLLLSLRQKRCQVNTDINVAEDVH